jgi:ribosomal protein S18 acetylase RimI-like enzyme
MIVFLEPEFAAATALLLEQTILESPFYSPLAKSEEIAGLTASKLLAMPSEDVLLAVENNVVLGVLVSSTQEAGLLWLSWCVVSPAARGRGVAGALITAFHASAKARGVHKTWCDSRVDNAASARMLEKAGYRLVTTLEQHWYGLDYLIWERLVVS